MGNMNKQRGAALIISLIMLLILSLIAVASVQTVTTAERSQAAQRDKNFAFQAAEIALRFAEEQAQTWSNDGVLATSARIVHNDTPRATDTQLLNEAFWDCTEDLNDLNNQGCSFLAANSIPGAREQPRYKIECDVNGEGIVCFVTVRAVGRGNSMVMLQSRYLLTPP